MEMGKSPEAQSHCPRAQHPPVLPNPAVVPPHPPRRRRPPRSAPSRSGLLVCRIRAEPPARLLPALHAPVCSQ